MLVVLFTTIMLVDLFVAIMQVLFSAVHYAHDYFYCNYTGDCFCCSYVCDNFKQQLYIPFFNWYPFFIKLTRKNQKAEGILSNLHFTTLVNILPKFRYFVGRIYIKVGQKIHSVLLLSRQANKRWGHLGFLERGKSQKRGEGSSRNWWGGMTPFTNYAPR